MKVHVRDTHRDEECEVVMKRIMGIGVKAVAGLR